MMQKKILKDETRNIVETSSSKMRADHWEALFQRVDYTQVLWHQNSPQRSVELIEKYVDEDANSIDVGSGASYLVEKLLQKGYKNLTLLDTSKTALEKVKARIGDDKAEFICADVLNFKNENMYDLWHDRAVLHFLLSKKEREEYFKVLYNSLKPNAVAVISTFRVAGPTQCAGLDIVQYDHQKMLKELPSNLSLIESEEFTHITPKETIQEYIYFVIQKR